MTHILYYYIHDITYYYSNYYILPALLVLKTLLIKSFSFFFKSYESNNYQHDYPIHTPDYTTSTISTTRKHSIISLRPNMRVVPEGTGGKVSTLSRPDSVIER